MHTFFVRSPTSWYSIIVLYWFSNDRESKTQTLLLRTKIDQFYHKSEENQDFVLKIWSSWYKIFFFIQCLLGLRIRWNYRKRDLRYYWNSGIAWFSRLYQNKCIKTTFFVKSHRNWHTSPKHNMRSVKL